MNRNFLLALSLFMFLTLTPCNAQRNEKLCCGHKPDSAVIVLNNQAVNAYTNHSNSPDSVKKAMTVQGVRIAPRTVVRCIGNVILVNDQIVGVNVIRDAVCGRI